MKRIAPFAAVLALITAPAFAFGIDISMPNLTFPDTTISQGTAAPTTLSTAGQPGN
jgi:hypothetical protein